MNTRLGDHRAQELHGHVGLHLVDGLHGGHRADEDRGRDDQRQRADRHDVHLLDDLAAAFPDQAEMADDAAEHGEAAAEARQSVHGRAADVPGR